MSNFVVRLIRSRSVVSGAALYIAMRWFDRAIGVVSTVILARLLTAEDFGIVAIAGIVLGLAVVLLDLGINLTVVQRRNMDRDSLDTAWTLRLLQNAAVSVALVLASSTIADHYREPRLTSVIITLAFAYLLDGMTGLGPLIFQRRQEYAREAAFFMSKRVIGFAVTVLLALWIRSYWALIAGTVLSNLSGVAMSYAMHRVAPRFTLSRWRDFLGASSWLTIRAIGSYVALNLDKLVIGRRDGQSVLGVYSLADQVAAMPASELLAPTSRALFPAMAASQEDHSRLRRLYLGALGLQSSIALPASAGLALVTGDLVPVVLGAKWNDVVPIMVPLALAYGASGLISSGGYLLTSLGAFWATALLQWATVALLGALIIGGFPEAGAVQIAWFRAVLGTFSIVGIAVLVRRQLPIVTFRDMLRQVIRPVLATTAMAAVLHGVHAVTASLSIYLRLGVEVAVGAVVYTVALVSLWHLSGRPDGAEQWVLQRIHAAVKRGSVAGE